MKQLNRYSIILFAVVLISGIMTAVVLACTVPVFRYALERWEPDAYELVIFTDGPLSGSERDVATWLKSTVSERETRANLAVTVIDVSGEMDSMYRDIWTRENKNATPHAVLRYPRSLPGAPPVWSGNLSEDIARSLIDSPVRRELTRRIMDGQSAVFLFVESGNAARDDKAYKMLESTVREMRETLSIPEQAPVESPQFVPISEDGPELRIDFSIIRISRDDPAEDMLIRMLDGSEPDLADYRDYPMTFPVYGRGRALYALVGDGISERNVQESCVFLIEACSCQVKALNPGVDLLVTADWESSLQGQWVRDVELPPLVGFSELVADAAETAAEKDAVSPSVVKSVDARVVSEEGESVESGEAVKDVVQNSKSDNASVAEPVYAEASSPVVQAGKQPVTNESGSNGGMTRNLFVVIGFVLIVTAVLSVVVLRRKPGGGR